jgi:hypothetical protein
METPVKRITREEIKALVDDIPGHLLEMTLSYVKYMATRKELSNGRDLSSLFGSITGDFMEEWDKPDHVRCQRL